jgi:hypothetical protein
MMLEFEIKQDTTPANDAEMWQASLVDRPNLIYCGKTEHEAIAWMLGGVAELGWKRYLDPEDPSHYSGVSSDPIQHCLELLAEVQVATLAERRSYLRSEYAGTVPKNPVSEREKARLSELAGNISTAMAALARIKND